MSDIRQRSTISSRQQQQQQQQRSSSNMNDISEGAGLEAKSLIDSTPQQHGVVLKLHIPLFYSILPLFIQQFIMKWFSSLFGLIPSWKERYLILCGSYLYKYQDRSSSVPKGSPFDIETINTDIIHIHNDILSDVQIGDLPTGYTSIFVVSTLRRKHYYAVSNNEEAMIWVRSINDARQEAITMNMGHATNVPYPSSWKYFNTLGKSLVKSKIRIKNRMEQSQLNEMEMTEFSFGSNQGGPLPRGYHG